MEYHITYEDLDKHWIVFTEAVIEALDCKEQDETQDEIIMRFPSRDQAESFVEKRINYIWDTENNSEKEA